MTLVSRLCRPGVSAFDGRGGLLRSGRWHEQGHRVVYAAASEALAVLEVLVHLSSLSEVPVYKCARASIPDELILDIEDVGGLINPEHREFTRITVAEPVDFEFDARLRRHLN